MAPLAAVILTRGQWSQLFFRKKLSNGGRPNSRLKMSEWKKNKDGVMTIFIHGVEHFSCKGEGCGISTPYRYAWTGPVPFYCLSCAKDMFEERYQDWEKRIKRRKDF